MFIVEPALQVDTASQWTEKAALIIAHFECPTRRGTFKISAAFLVHQETAHISPQLPKKKQHRQKPTAVPILISFHTETEFYIRGSLVVELKGNL